MICLPAAPNCANCGAPKRIVEPHATAQHDLVHEYSLLVYPVVLGSGKKLFPEGFTTSQLVLVDHRALASGVVLATYRATDER